MNRFSKLVKDVYPIAVFVLAAVLLFVPLPMKIIEVLMSVEYIFALFLFCFKARCDKKRLTVFPNLIIGFSLFTLAIVISTVRTFLKTTEFDAQIPIIRIIGTLICRENVVCGLFTTLLLSGALIIFCKLFISKQTEAGARYCLDTMNSKLREIENLFIQNKITKQDAKDRKEDVQKTADYFSAMDGAAKFFAGTINAFLIMCIVVIAGGVALGIIELELNWQEALRQYVMLSTGYLVIFIIPLFIVGLSLRVQ